MLSGHLAPSRISESCKSISRGANAGPLWAAGPLDCLEICACATRSLLPTIRHRLGSKPLLPLAAKNEMIQEPNNTALAPIPTLAQAPALLPNKRGGTSSELDEFFRYILVRDSSIESGGSYGPPREN